MRFPKMSGSPTYRTTVARLDGGLRCGASDDRLTDGQLSEADNVWWHDGALRTRPGRTLQQVLPAAEHVTVQQIDERETVLLCFSSLPESDSRHDTHCRFFCRSVTADGSPGDVPGGTGEAVVTRPDAAHFPTAFVCRAADTGSGERRYAFLSGGEILCSDPDAAEGQPGFAEALPYIPTIVMGGRGRAMGEVGKGSGGVSFEPLNLLTERFICCFSTDGKANAFDLPYTDLVGSINVSLRLPGETALNFALSAQQPSMSVDYPLTAAQFGVAEGTYSSIKLSVWADRSRGTVYMAVYAAPAGSTKTEVLALPEMGANCVRITAGREDTGRRARICRMRRAVWFGGERSGQNGGTRLFVCGDAEHPNRMYWSDVSQPLYFPESNYAYIGDAGQALTAFGRQGDALIVFKEHEMYAVQYAAGDRITAEDVQSGAVTDVAAQAAVFPIAPLHPSVGCDCPDTVRLVNNRLVWADSRGYIYALPTVSQYNERVVREIGENVRPLLQGVAGAVLKAAFSCEYGGCYLLFCGGTVLVLDAERGAFSAMRTSSDEDTLQSAQCWSRWTLGAQPVAAAGDRDGLRIVMGGAVWSFGAETDSGVPIKARFSTKLFDLGAPYAKKAVRRVFLHTEGEAAMRVAYRTENGAHEETQEVCAEHSDDGATVRLTPALRRVSRFGLHVESEQPIAVGQIAVDYAVHGEVK